MKFHEEYSSLSEELHEGAVSSNRKDGIWKQHILFSGRLGWTNCKGEGVASMLLHHKFQKNSNNEHLWAYETISLDIWHVKESNYISLTKEKKRLMTLWYIWMEAFTYWFLKPRWGFMKLSQAQKLSWLKKLQCAQKV